MSLNPKKEFQIPFSVGKVGEAILSVQSHFPKEYQLEKADNIFNQYRFIAPGVLMDMGYYIDFFVSKVDEENSKIDIEVSRRAGAINTNNEMAIATEILKSTIDRLSLALRGELSSHAEHIHGVVDKQDKTLSRVLMFVILLLVGFAVAWVISNRH